MFTLFDINSKFFKMFSVIGRFLTFYEPTGGDMFFIIGALLALLGIATLVNGPAALGLVMIGVGISAAYLDRPGVVRKSRNRKGK